MRIIKKYLLFGLLFTFLSFYTQGQKKVNIGISIDKKTDQTSILLASLKKEITAVVGEDAELFFSAELENNFNTDLAKENYKTIVDNNVDIILAFGVVNNYVISQFESYTKPTIVFGSLSKELSGNNDAEKNKSNFISFVTSQSYKDDLELLIKLSNAKEIGIIIENTFLENFPIKSTFDKIGEELNISTKLIPFSSTSQINANLDNLDAVYIASATYFSNDEIKELSNIFISKKLPSFSTIPASSIENGILATNHGQSEIDQYFRRIALTVESVVNGVELSDLESNINTQKNLTVNYNTAEKIGLPLKYSLIASTSFTGDPKEIIADKTYNLKTIIKEAIDKNLSLKEVQKDLLISEKDKNIANSAYLPNLNLNAVGNYIDPDLAQISNGQNPEISTLGNLTLSQTILSENANANIGIKKSLLKAQKESYNSESLNTIYNVATAYFTALILKANLSIQNQNLELTKYNLKIAQENYEAGQSGKSDVLRFRSQMAQNTQQMIEAINQLEKGYYVLNQLLNNAIDTKIDVEEAQLKSGIFKNYNYEELGKYLDDPTLRIPFVKFLIQEGMANSPELKSLDYNIDAAKRSQKLYGVGRFIPTIALQGQYNYEFSRSGVGVNFPQGFPAMPQGYYTVGLNVSIPIFNQNNRNLNKQIADIQKDQLEISKDNVALSIEKNINDAVLDLVNQISNIELSKVFENTAKEALELTTTSYENGAVNIVQLLDAQNNFLQAQLASANANYNYLQVSMQLERSLGLFFILQNETEREAFIERFLKFINNQD